MLAIHCSIFVESEVDHEILTWVDAISVWRCDRSINGDALHNNIAA